MICLDKYFQKISINYISLYVPPERCENVTSKW